MGKTYGDALCSKDWEEALLQLWQGRHTRGEGFTTDREKMNEAALLGWTVIEVTPEHIKSGQLREWLTKAFQSRGATAC